MKESLTMGDSVQTAAIGQTEAFAQFESYRFLKDRMGFTSPTVNADDFAAVSGPIGTVLDAGCGTGVNLSEIVRITGASAGVGVEPSEDSVRQLRLDHVDDEFLRFETASIHALPFASDSFDLVVCWSVLHWVGREEYLQALGELVRVTAKWLVVMDFVAAEDYRVEYRHRDGLFTYKTDFEVPLLASGALECVSRSRWWEPSVGGDRVGLTEQELHPFHSRVVSYHARKACTFRKTLGALPLLSESDFSQGQA